MQDIALQKKTQESLVIGFSFCVLNKYFILYLVISKMKILKEIINHIKNYSQNPYLIVISTT